MSCSWPEECGGWLSDGVALGVYDGGGSAEGGIARVACAGRGEGGGE